MANVTQKSNIDVLVIIICTFHEETAGDIIVNIIHQTVGSEREREGTSNIIMYKASNGGAAGL